MHDDLEVDAVDSLTLHRPKLFDVSIQQPDVFVQNALHFARAAAERYITFARAWPQARIGLPTIACSGMSSGAFFPGSLS